MYLTFAFPQINKFWNMQGGKLLVFTLEQDKNLYARKKSVLVSTNL